MIEIKRLRRSDYSKAIALKIYYFSEETCYYQGYVPSAKKELEFMTSWVDEENNDHRVLLGAYQDDDLLGFAGASYAEEDDSRNGMELNYLFVEDNVRGQGVSLLLLHRLVEEFKARMKEEMVVYNYHCSPSNNYYRRLGGVIIRNFEVFDGDLSVDVFLFDINSLRNMIIEKMR